MMELRYSIEVRDAAIGTNYMTTVGERPFDREARYDLRRPESFRKYLEVRAVFEAAMLLPAAPLLATQNRGDGRQVMLLPGLLTDDRSTWPLRRFLQFLGYETLPWGLGRNYGQPEKDVDRIIDRISGVRRRDEPITLIGWSLGGVIARGVALRDPVAVREVITLGTPVEGGPKYTAAGDRFAARQGINLDDLERHIHEINAAGINCPLTVIYSRSDGVVGWRAAIDRYNAHARHERVPGSHFGLGVNPLVWKLIAQTLSATGTP